MESDRKKLGLSLPWRPICNIDGTVITGPSNRNLDTIEIPVPAANAGHMNCFFLVWIQKI